MTELFNGGEMDSFSPSDGSSEESGTTPTDNWDTNFSRCGIRFTSNGTSYIDTATWSNQTSGYVHYAMRLSSTPIVTSILFSLVNGSGTEVVRINLNTSSQYVVQYLDAFAVWQTAATISAPVGLTDQDIYWNFAASGNIDFYSAGTRLVNWTGDLSHLSGVVKARFYAHRGNPYISQVMADTTTTVGKKLFTLPPTGIGANTAWTGDYTSVDEITYDDGDTIVSGTAAQVETYSITNPSVTGYVVDSVTVAARAKYDGSGPSNLQLALRSGGTDYFSASKAMTVGLVPTQNIWEADPNTAAAWDNGDISSLQIGVKSIT